MRIANCVLYGLMRAGTEKLTKFQFFHRISLIFTVRQGIFRGLQIFVVAI